MLSQIFTIDRKLRIDHKRLLASPFVNNDIIIKVDKYLIDYSNYYNLCVKDILYNYCKFVNRYSENINNFISTDKYPIQLGINYNIDRLEYDIALILSSVVIIHRHRIFNNIHKYCSKLNGKTLIIGVGSGLELEFLRYKLIFKCFHL